MRRMNVNLPMDTFGKLELMSGPEAWSVTIEKLVNREWRRRVKRMSLEHTEESSLIMPEDMASYTQPSPGAVPV
jgi:hypothetical protein